MRAKCAACGGTGLPTMDEFTQSAVQHGYNCPTCEGDGYVETTASDNDVRSAVAMQLLRIEPLMAEIRMVFAHRDHVTWLVASGGFRP